MHSWLHASQTLGNKRYVGQVTHCFRRINKGIFLGGRQCAQVAILKIDQSFQTLAWLKVWAEEQTGRRKPARQTHSGVEHRRNIAIVFGLGARENDLDLRRHQIVKGGHLQYAILGEIGLSNTPEGNRSQKRNLDALIF